MKLMRLIGSAGLSQLSRELNVTIKSRCLMRGLRLLLPGLRIHCIPLSVGLKVSNKESMALGWVGVSELGGSWDGGKGLAVPMNDLGRKERGTAYAPFRHQGA